LELLFLSFRSEGGGVDGGFLGGFLPIGGGGIKPGRRSALDTVGTEAVDEGVNIPGV